MRQPRPAELCLLRRLAHGPQPLREGPVGRCTKRGWCRSEIATDAEGGTRVLFALTDLGRAWLAEGAIRQGRERPAS